MATAVSPTKANLMAAKKSLTLAQTGYSLLDRKRNILIRETMGLIDSGKGYSAADRPKLQRGV